MRNAKQTVVLFQNSGAAQNLVADLSSQGTLTYCQAETPEQLHLLLKEQQVALVGFQATQLPLAITVASIRTLIGLGGLIVVTDLDEQDAVADYLLAGADAVIAAPVVSVMTVLAWHTALVRKAEGFMRLRSERHVAPVTSQHSPTSIKEEPKAWLLVEGGWYLKSPAGDTFSLTSSERFFLESFVGERNKRVSRASLLIKNASLNESSRAIDSLISRLRRKLKEKKTHLPIKAVHGWGYSFSGLLLNESDKKVALRPTPATHLSMISSLRQELMTPEQFEEQLRFERFDFSYYPVFDTQTDQMVGAIAVLEWQDAQGQRIDVDEIAPYLAAMGVLDRLSNWALRQLQLEMRAWETEYAVQIPLFIRLPTSLVLDSRFEWERLTDLGQSDLLTVVLSDLSPDVDAVALRLAVRKLQQSGLAVWACTNSPMILQQLSNQVGIEGVYVDRLLGRDASQQSPELMQLLAYAQQHQWPILAGTIETVAQRDLIQQLGVRYLAGSVIAMKLSKDGLLLFWASRHSPV